MSPVNHKTAWRDREQPYTRPRFSRDDLTRARRDAEWDEAYERAGKWVCIVVVALALAFFAGVAL